MINAELGITSANVNATEYNDVSPAVARLVGKEGNFGEELGLDNKWAYNIIRQVGNYGRTMRSMSARTPR